MDDEEVYNVEVLSRRRWAYPRDNERNYVAAIFHAISTVLMIISLVHLSWFRCYGDVCSPFFALYQFLRPGYFQPTTVGSSLEVSNGRVITSSETTVVIDYVTGNQVLQCISPEILDLMRVLVMLSLVCIFCSMVGFCLDMIGPNKKTLRFVRRNALPSTWAVLIIISMVGVCYLISNAISMEYVSRSPYRPQYFRVTYEYGVYAITAAGAVSLLATACNLLQDSAGEDVIETQEGLVEEFEGLEAFSVGMNRLPPPPPYTP